ncbi:MAG: tetraacyldisaccharide 4'-kinase [Bacteroidetes bacterium]|nr:tetraacyldisaccharide 4'-kinase [Bacteroidota bacterium]
MVIVKILFYPLSLIYGLAGCIRNILFDIGILPSTTYNFPVISIGNLTVGGTGKSPHIEYLIRLLQDKYNIATLSRGYKRSTKGFRLVDVDSTTEQVGDEALQIKRKFRGIIVAVDENRRRGIQLIKEKFPEIDIILLDDALQHRYVKPGLSILLTDYHNLFTTDHLLPFGTLREPRFGCKRADIVIITKTDKILSPILKRNLSEEIHPEPYQNLHYSYLDYGNLIPLSGTPVEENDIEKKKYSSILLVVGIANPYPLQDHLKKMCTDLVTVQFGDHHRYTVDDIHRIREEYDKMYLKNKIIITTEKDAMRLQEPLLKEHISGLPIFYIPVFVTFHKTISTSFDRLILDYVSKTKKAT